MALKTRINSHERGLRFRYGDFRGLLGPGVYRLWSRLWSRTRNTIEVVNTLAFAFDHPLIDVLLQHPEVRAALEVVDLADHERAIVWKDGRVARILGPGRYAFWNTPYEVRVEAYDVSDFRFEHERLNSVLTHPEASKWLTGVEVEDYEDVLVYRDGERVDRLKEGKHFFWKGTGRVDWKAIDRREQVQDVSGQEIMTRDKVTLRVNLVVTYTVVDVVRAVEAVADFAQTLYREAQLILREAVGVRTLDALLTDKAGVGDEVRDALRARAEAFGVAITSVGLRDVILPGEMKTILNRVIEAEKQAQANLIRRREETAAARSQANTAKLLAENPALSRMKELEALQEILSGAKATFMLGRGDLVDQLGQLVNGRTGEGDE